MCSNGLWGNQDFLHSNKSFLLVKLAKTLNIRAKKAWGKKMQTMPFTKITSTVSRYLLKAQIPLDSFQWLRNGSNHQIDRKWQNASSFIPLHKHKNPNSKFLLKNSVLDAFSCQSFFTFMDLCTMLKLKIAQSFQRFPCNLEREERCSYNSCFTLIFYIWPTKIWDWIIAVIGIKYMGLNSNRYLFVQIEPF